MTDAARAPRSLRALATSPALWVAVLTLATYTLYAWLDWRRYRTSSYDLGIFTQAVAQYAAGRPPVASIKGEEFNLLGEHFHPILALLAPLFWVAPSPFTLQVAQVVLVAASAVVVTVVAERVLGRGAAWCVGLAYALSWGVQQAVASQFHEVAFAAPLLALAAGAIVLRHWRTAAVAAGLLVFVKEDLGLTVAALALVLGWRSGRWLLASGLAVWGIGWSLLAMRVVMPALAGGHWRFTSDIAAHPLLALAGALGEPAKATTLGLVLVASGLVGLRSPLMLVVLPTLLWRFVSTNPHHWGPGFHYNLVLMPLAFLAIVDALALLRPAGSRSRDARGHWTRWVPAAVLAAAVGVLVLVPNQPLMALAKPTTWQAPRAESAARVLALVPDDAVVASDHALIDRLALRTQVYFLGVDGPTPDWVLIDARAGGVPRDAEVAAYASALYPGTRWNVVTSEDGYQLARRV